MSREREESQQDGRGRAGLLAGPALFAVILLMPLPAGMTPLAARVAAVALLMAVWWITEAIPIAATALLPLVLFPLLGIAPVGDTAAPYANPIIFLFLGGFIIAIGLEKSGLHRRIALRILATVGSRAPALIGGFMAATALLSMWISNTAAALMMLPIALSVADFAEKRDPRTDFAGFTPALLLGLAYAGSIGGLATLIGTPPNALLAAFMAETYQVGIGFGQWMLLGLPLVLVGLPLTWLLLVRVLFRLGTVDVGAGADIIAEQRRALDGVRRAEQIVAGIAMITAALWIFRPLLQNLVPGLNDTTIAMAGALLMFFVPAAGRGSVRMLSWKDAERLPWAVLLLFGGGLSLASAIESSGLAAWIGGALTVFASWPVVLIALLVTLVVVLLTELTSNTATAASFLPIVAALAGAISVDPLLLAIPAALAASCAFMLPVATPPNAIVYGSGRVTIGQMARAGLLLNVLWTLLIVLAVFTIGRPLFGI